MSSDGTTGCRRSSLDEMLSPGISAPLRSRPWAARVAVSLCDSLCRRDVRQFLKVLDLEAFQRFVRLCAGRSGQILNFSSLATDCGITHNTAKAWISVLEASYILFQLRPHYVNFSKRLIKSPKIYFYDTGLLCWLLGIQEPSQLVAHPLRGSIFETLIVAELVKTRFNLGERAALYFWRDSNGNEVDIVANLGKKLMPIEIKSGQTVNRDFSPGCNVGRRWPEIWPSRRR